VTRSYLHINNLAPNRALKAMIEEYLAKNQAATPVALAGGRSTRTVAATASIAVDQTIQVVVSKSDYDAEEGGRYGLISVVPPDVIFRVPSDIVIVVDTSGSMGNTVSAAGAESSGLTILDIVKHAINTIIQVLGPDDRLSVISYSNNATLIFDLLAMNDAGKDRAKALVAALYPDGMTNLWDGLHTGLETLSKRSSTGSRNVNSAVLLLTDGEPNIEPPRGHIPMLKRYKDSHGGQYPGIISTFGFGYTMDRFSN
jgi:Mg-chelatase subunit ChlD